MAALPRGSTLADVGAAWGAADATRTADAGAAEVKSYLRACAEYETAPWPTTVDNVVGFLLQRCLEGYSSATLGAAASAVLRDPRAGPAPSETETARIRGAVKRMSVEFPFERHHVRPLLDPELELLHAHLLPWLRKRNTFALGFWAMLLVARDGCLRSVEFLGGKRGKRGLLASQVTRVTLADGSPTLLLDVPFRKTSLHKRDKALGGVALPHRSDADAHLDAYLALDAYATAAGTVLGRSAFPLFPRRSRVDGHVLDAVYGDYSYATALTDFRWLMAQAGFGTGAGAHVGAPADYALHSPRRGCATLLLAMGVPGPTVMKIGHWADPRSGTGGPWAAG